MSAFRHLIPLILAASAFASHAADSTPNNAQNSGSTSSGESSSAPSGTAEVVGTMAVTVPTIVLVPYSAENPNLADGCWTRLFDGTDLKGKDMLTIAGPMDLQSLKTPSGINWSKRAESLVVGPKAKVTVFENEMFKNKQLTFQANQKVPSLRKELGFMNSIDSIKVSCVK